MRKIIFLVSAICCLYVTSSCSKDDGIQNSQDLAALITVLHGNISWNDHNVTKGNDDEWICFKNREAYESIIDMYACSDDETLLEFAESINYQSMLLSLNEDEREKKGIYDDFLAAILNVNGEVQIGDYLFKLDYSKDSAYILNLTNSDFLQVDMNYDFFATLDGDSENHQVQYCNNKQNGKEETSTTIKWKVVYQNAVVYHSLLAKINKPGIINSHSTPYIFLSVGSSCTYTVNKRTAVQQTIASYNNGGDGKSYSYKPYSDAKGLKQYYFAATFQWYENEYDYPLNLRYGIISKTND